MAIAKTRSNSDWTARWLPYGAAALVSVAAIISAWPLLQWESNFLYLALALVAVGTPASALLRAAGTNRRLVNIVVVGASLVFIFAMVSRVALPTASGNGFRHMLLVSDRAPFVLVIQVFITVAMFRSFSLLTDRDLALTIIPAMSVLILSAILVRGVVIMAALLSFFLGTLYLLAFDHQESWAQRAHAQRLLAQRRRWALLASYAAGMWLVLVPVIYATAMVFNWMNLPRTLLMRYRGHLPYVIARQIFQMAAPAWIVPLGPIRLGSGLPMRDIVMFRVDCEEAALWRGNAFDTYTGDGWKNSNWPQRKLLVAQDDAYPVPRQDAGLIAGVSSRDLEQTFRLETPMQGGVLAAYEPAVVRGPLLRPRVDDRSSLTTSRVLRPGTIYRVVSRRKQAPGPAAYRPGVTLSGEERERYLALPPIPDRTHRLARTITADERDDLHRALALRAYLESNFFYRERVTPPPRDADYVTHFLFNMDGAYCDYFASAMAVMARIKAIPSRVVTGYRSAEEDEQTGWWIVREKHAHSWTEVFLDGYGWFELDPSPTLGSRPSLLEQAQHAIRRALDAAREATLAPFRALAATQGWWWKLSAVIAGLALAFLALHYLRREKAPPLPRGAEAEELRRYVRRGYDRMCRWLGAWGLPKPLGATASEYGSNLGHALGPQAGPMLKVIGAYVMAEYGGRRPGLAEVRGIAEHLRTVLGMRRQLLRRAAELTQEEQTQEA